MKNLVKALYSKVPVFEYTESTFYDFIENTFDNFLSNLRNTEPCEITKELNSQFIKQISYRRFITVVSDICEKYKEILSLIYKGDVLNATNKLHSLLKKRNFGNCTFVEQFANYINFRQDYFLNKVSLYRCVDFKKGEDVSCLHLPFNLRQYASKGRFNQTGTICLYLSDSLECASLESGQICKGKIRWYGIFEAKKNISYFNLVVPSSNAIDNMNSYDLFTAILAYPIYLLCLTECKHKYSPFNEEYLFSQLIFSVFFINPNDSFPKFEGIVYTSVKCPQNVNFVIPAKYKSNIPPKKDYSFFIDEHFTIKQTKELGGRYV